MPSRPLAILFDLDGTLVDTIELIMQSMEFAFREFHGAHPTRAQWLEGLGITLRTQMEAWARTPEELDWLIARYRLYQGEHHERMTAPYDGVRSVLDELRASQHPMGIVTSKYHALAYRVLTHVRFIEYFDVIIGGDSIERPKPDPQPVVTALERLGAAPQRAMFVGDSPHDIRSGNAAGVATVAATWGPFSTEQLEVARPTYWLPAIQDLPGLIRRHPVAPGAIR
jgi:pyrophosphatase PpaX